MSTFLWIFFFEYGFQDILKQHYFIYCMFINFRYLSVHFVSKAPPNLRRKPGVLGLSTQTDDRITVVPWHSLNISAGTVPVTCEITVVNRIPTSAFVSNLAPTLATFVRFGIRLQLLEIAPSLTIRRAPWLSFLLHLSIRPSICVSVLYDSIWHYTMLYNITQHYTTLHYIISRTYTLLILHVNRSNLFFLNLWFCFAGELGSSAGAPIW